MYFIFFLKKINIQNKGCEASTELQRESQVNILSQYHIIIPVLYHFKCREVNQFASTHEIWVHPPVIPHCSLILQPIGYKKGKLALQMMSTD